MYYFGQVKIDEGKETPDKMKYAITGEPVSSDCCGTANKGEEEGEEMVELEVKEEEVEGVILAEVSKMTSPVHPCFCSKGWNLPLTAVSAFRVRPQCFGSK
jgi:hypothetical protein